MPSEGALRDGHRAGYELIETLRFEPEAGFVRGAAHLRRLFASASSLGFRCDDKAVGEAMRKAVSAAGGALRVRLTLARDGSVACAAVPFTPLAPGAFWRIALASARLDSSDPLLAHKTSRREAYDLARREFPASDVDEVILLNEKGQICEGTITNVFLKFPHEGDSLVTPDRSSGLLPGILRAEMIAGGAARERVVQASELTQATEILVGNSLRGLMQAVLATPDGNASSART